MNRAKSLAKEFTTAITADEAAISLPGSQPRLTTDTDITEQPKPRQIGIFIKQFENLSNYIVHYECTGPEIWNQVVTENDSNNNNDDNNNQIDAFVMSAGTGGTIAGVAK